MRSRGTSDSGTSRGMPRFAIASPHVYKWPGCYTRDKAATSKGAMGPIRRGKATRARGFTLVEIAISVALMAFAALLMMAALTSSRQADSLSSERSLAANAIRAYIEAMRQYYPATQSAKDMSAASTTNPTAY